MARIFISYRHEDSGASAGRLDDRLRERFGRDNVFMDIDTIEPGLDFTEVIERTVASCDVLIALIGRQWLTSTDAAGQRRLDDPEDFVRREIAMALRRNIRVIPALVEDTSMPRAANLPDDLQPLTRREAVELSDTHFHRDVDELIVVLDRVLGVGPSPASPAGTGPPHVLPPVRSSYLRSWRFWGLACLIFAGMAFIVVLYVVPQLMLPSPKLSERPAPQPPPGGRSVSPTPEPVVSPSPSAGPVQSYRMRTWYGPMTNVEFSVFVNDVQVGVYSADGVTVDLTRFIKPGANKVRIAWTPDPTNLGSHAVLFIEVKQGERWSPLITREVYSFTQAGETVTPIIHHGDRPQKPPPDVSNPIPTKDHGFPSEDPSIPWACNKATYDAEICAKAMGERR
jgi:TIR domain